MTFKALLLSYLQVWKWRFSLSFSCLWAVYLLQLLLLFYFFRKDSLASVECRTKTIHPSLQMVIEVRGNYTSNHQRIGWMAGIIKIPSWVEYLNLMWNESTRYQTKSYRLTVTCIGYDSTIRHIGYDSTITPSGHRDALHPACIRILVAPAWLQGLHDEQSWASCRRFRRFFSMPSILPMLIYVEKFCWADWWLMVNVDLVWKKALLSGWLVGLFLLAIMPPRLGTNTFS